MKARVNLGFCACGCDWFELVGDGQTPETMPNGGVTLYPDGRIQSFTGKVICARCKAPYVPPRDRLKVVR